MTTLHDRQQQLGRIVLSRKRRKEKRAVCESNPNNSTLLVKEIKEFSSGEQHIRALPAD